MANDIERLCAAAERAVRAQPFSSATVPWNDIVLAVLREQLAIIGTADGEDVLVSERIKDMMAEGGHPK